MNPLMLASFATGLGGAVGKMFARGKSNREMRRLEGEDPEYKSNPLAAERLAIARSLLNARTPGAARVERNIYANQGNQIANIMQNATDSSQALALASQAYGQTGSQLQQLGLNEEQDYQRRYNNLVEAQQGAITEGDKVYNDTLRRYDNRVNFAQAKSENRQNTWGDISNLGFALTNFGFAGGFEKMFGGGAKSAPIGGSGRSLPLYQKSVYESLLNNRNRLMKKP